MPSPLRDLAESTTGSSLQLVASDRCTLNGQASQTAAAPSVAGVLDALDAHIAVLEPDGRILAVNAAWEAFAAANDGHGVGVGSNYLDVCAAADGDPLAAEALVGLRAVLDGVTGRFTMEYPCHGLDVQRWFRLTATPIEHAGPTRAVVRHELITTERRHRDEVELPTQLLDVIDVAVAATDLTGCITAWNRAATHITGWSSGEALGREAFELLFAPEDRPKARPVLPTLLARGSWEGTVELRRRDGQPVAVHLRDRLVRGADGAPLGIVVVATETSQRAAAERELARRNAWLHAITERMGDGLCTLNADGRITYANPTAEQLFRATGAHVLGGSFLNRLVGPVTGRSPHEFSEQLIGRDFTGSLAEELTEDRLLRPDGSVLPIEYVASKLPVSESGDGEGWVVVFRDISQRVEAERELREQAEHARWMARIWDGLEHDHFRLFAQPIIDLTTREVVQHELLLRLDDPDDGIIAPAAFLPTAEAFGLATSIDRWVLARAIGLAAEGHDVEVNLSAQSIDDPSLPHLIQQLLTETGADPRKLVIEMTETAMLADVDAAAHLLTRLRALGCRLALDDFGTGYAAFTYLKRLPVDVLKIDIEFVRDAVQDASSRHVIEAMVALARSFGLLTVAEGVEDAATLELLARLGVDQAQGYHLGRPAPVEEVLR